MSEVMNVGVMNVGQSNNPLSGLTCNGTVETDALRLFWCGLICGHISLESCYGFDSIAFICICVMHVLYFYWIG